MRFGTIAIVGRSNVGKSTFLNRVLGEPLAIVSPLPQTTRDNVLGVVHRKDAQLAFLDTPGVHQPRSELGRRMNASALEAARAADVVLFMTDISALAPPKKHAKDKSVQELDLELLANVPKTATMVLVVNKVDALRDKTKLLPALVAFQAAREFAALIPISVQADDGVERVLAALAEALPEGEAGFDEDTLTDRPTSFFAREYIREQVLLAMRGEIPHAVAVSIDEFVDGQKSSTIRATVHVEKVGQRKIIIGTGGLQIKQIRVGAQARIAELLGHKVHLELFVRVTPQWKSMPRQLAELGYEAAAGAKTEASKKPRAKQKRTRAK
ncbi:MAG TPA: GTPase Era [Polyangiaceae bacterium]|jgi:GTP-binding protein Era